MTENINATRRLAPDTKWILTAMGTGLALIVGIMQYQLDSLAKHFEYRIERTADLTLERARSDTMTRKVMDEAFRPRDAILKRLQGEVTGLREERAKVGEALNNINTTLARIVCRRGGSRKKYECDEKSLKAHCLLSVRP